MKKRIKNKIHNGILYFISWMMAVAFAVSAWLWNACVPSLKPVCFAVLAVSMLWLLSFISINHCHIEGLCEEK